MTSRALAATFRPATTLVGRLRYAQKFILVGFVLLLPLGFIAAAYVGTQRVQTALSVKEREGIALISPLINLVADTAQARHVMVCARAGRTCDAMPDLDRDIAAFDATMSRSGTKFNVGQEWQTTRGLVDTARKADTEGYAAYNSAIADLLDLIVHVADRSNLTLDPELDTYYLIDTLGFRLPVLINTAGRSSDRPLVGGGADTEGALIELGLDNGIMATTRETVRRSIVTIASNTSDLALRRDLQDQFDALDSELDQLSILVNTAIAGRRPAAVPADAADVVRSQAVAFAARAARSLDGLLRARIEQANAQAGRVVLIAGVAALLGGYLFVGFYLGVVPPIRRIVTGLQAVAAGDLTGQVSVDTHDELSYVVRALNDTVALTKVARDRLALAATHDPLTALPNRTLVLDRLHHALLRTARSGRRTAVFFIDLDKFKIINDSYGHDAGDQVLRTVARRLTELVRTTDTVARLAGDEFVLISEDLESVDATLAIADRLLAVLSTAIEITVDAGTREVTVGASMGIAFADGTRELSPDALLRDADVAMYDAKQRGRGRVTIFDDALQVALERRTETQADLHQAIDNDQFVVHYQPIVDTTTRAVLGFEALARWQHPERGLLGPTEFIDVAEESGLTVPLGAAVLAKACAQIAEWRTHDGGGDLDVAVNVSAAQFGHPSFVPTVSTALTATRLEPTALWLEISETNIMADTTAAARTLHALRALGVHLSIDDFGTGYSSLAYLRRLPVEALKVDRSFVHGLGRDKEDEAIVATIVDLGRSLDLVMVAEGVETADQLLHLERLGCARVQGDHFGRPLPADQAWPRNRTGASLAR